MSAGIKKACAVMGHGRWRLPDVCPYGKHRHVADRTDPISPPPGAAVAQW